MNQDPAGTGRERIDAGLLHRVMQLLEEGRAPDLALLRSGSRGTEAEIERAFRAWERYWQLLAAMRRHPCAAAPLPAGTRLGDFTVDDVLAYGGMSVVYRARQASLVDRPVALKVFAVPPGEDAGEFMQRFRREARLAASVVHPHLAQVLGAGEDRGVLYYAMRLIEGETLERAIARMGDASDPSRCRSDAYVFASARIGLEIADALAAIHSRGLLHRDVKPSNVMLEGVLDEPLGELDRPAILIDFGLLRPAGTSDVTKSSVCAGTEAYSAPEARLGIELDARSDVFSLGATLHDLLSAARAIERPLAAAGLPDVRRNNPLVPRDLAAILATAADTRRESRYRDAGAVADDLRRFLQHRPVRARRAALVHAVALWVRRNPARAIRDAAIVLLMLVAVIGLATIARTARVVMVTAGEALASERAGRLAEALQHYERLLLSPVPRLLLPGTDQAWRRAEELVGSGPGSDALRRGVRLLAARDPERIAEGIRRLAESFDERVDFDPCVLPRLAVVIRDESMTPVAPLTELALLLYGRPMSPREAVAESDVRARVWDAGDGLAPALLQIALAPTPNVAETARFYSLSALAGVPSVDVLRRLWEVRADAGNPGEARRLAAAGIARIASSYRSAFRATQLPLAMDRARPELLGWCRALTAALRGEGPVQPTLSSDPDALAELLLLLRESGHATSLGELSADWDGVPGAELRIPPDQLRVLAACGTQQLLAALEASVERRASGRDVSDGWTELAFGIGVHSDGNERLIEHVLRIAPATRVRGIRQEHAHGIGAREATWNRYELSVDPRSHYPRPAQRLPTFTLEPAAPAASSAAAHAPPFAPRLSRTTGSVTIDFSNPLDPVMGSHARVEGAEVAWKSEADAAVPAAPADRGAWLAEQPDRSMVFLQFARRDDSRLRIRVPVPPRSEVAYVSLSHARAARDGLPRQGSATVELTASGRWVASIDVPSVTPRWSVQSLPHELLDGAPQLDLSLVLVRGTTTYRLLTCRVDFFESSD